MLGWELVATVVVALASVALLPVLLRRLPEPDAEPDDGPGWAGLVGWRTLTEHLLVAAVGVGVLLATVPRSWWPLWWPWVATALAGAVLDARTTWIPRHLCWAGWALAGPALLLAAVAGAPVRTLLTAAAGALGAAALLWLAWRLGRGQIGFADVRIMPMVGLAAGSLGPAGWWWSLLLGTGLGAVVAVLRRLLRRPAVMPYAPALVCGPALAAVLLRLTG